MWSKDVLGKGTYKINQSHVLAEISMSLLIVEGMVVIPLLAF